MIRTTSQLYDIGNKLHFLLESQYWSFEKLREFQWQNIKRLLAHAYKNVPYYRELFNKNGISINRLQCHGDLKIIPILKKDTIRQNLTKMIDENASASSLLPNYTGGSTGEPLKFYRDNNYMDWASACKIRHWKYYSGYNENEREALLWGADSRIENILNTKQILNIVLRNKDLKLNTFNITPFRFKKFIILFNLLKPKILRGYASSLLSLCDYLQDNHLALYPPRKVISSAELLSNKNRQLIEQILDAKVLDSYGSREVSQIAMDCDFQNGLHVAMENQYVELDNGSLLVTNLNNYAMPFIRYEIGDRAERLVQDQCQCGRGLERIQNITGRISDSLHFDGKIVHAEFITHLFYRDTKISRFQIVKNEATKRLYILIDNADPKLEAEIKKKLIEIFPTITIEMIVTKDFIPTNIGKYQLVIHQEDVSDTSSIPNI